MDSIDFQGNAGIAKGEGRWKNLCILVILWSDRHVESNPVRRGLYPFFCC